MAGPYLVNKVIYTSSGEECRVILIKPGTDSHGKAQLTIWWITEYPKEAANFFLRTDERFRLLGVPRWRVRSVCDRQLELWMDEQPLVEYHTRDFVISVRSGVYLTVVHFRQEGVKLVVHTLHWNLISGCDEKQYGQPKERRKSVRVIWSKERARAWSRWPCQYYLNH